MSAKLRKFWAPMIGFLLIVNLVPLSLAQQRTPQDQQKPKTAVIRFFANIDSAGVGALMQVVDSQYKAGVRQYIILMSSMGGDVLSGLLVYNYLKGLPIEVTTFNVGNVDSSAAIVFCAGSRRYAVPEARFLIHEISLTITASGPANLSIDLPSLEAQVAMLKGQEMTMARILAATVGKPQSEAESKIHAQGVLSAEQAKQWGLIHEIRTQLFDPADSNLVFAAPPPPPPTTPVTQPLFPLSPQYSYTTSGALAGKAQ